MDKKNALLTFLYAEKAKSEIIIGLKLLGSLQLMEGERMEGAREFLDAYMGAVLAELNLAGRDVGDANLKEAEKIMETVSQKIKNGGFEEARRILSRALSKITTACGRAVDILSEEGLIRE